MKQKTREELEKENVALQIANKQWDEADKTRREQFSKVLNAPVRIRYGTEDRDTYSWAEIFAEIGKLLAREDNLNLRIQIEKLTHTVGHLEDALIEDRPEPQNDPRH